MYSLTLLFLFFSSLPPSHNMINNDQQSLLAFRSSVTQDPHNSLSNWIPNTAMCNWSGIACVEAQERVLSITLKGMDLKGSVSSYIANLSFLQSIDLSYNALYGSIPPQLGSLYQLRHLSLRRNRLEGTIPSSLGNLSKLTHLDLGVNKLSGYIPGEIGILRNLMLLDLSTNYLGGTIPSLGRLQNLERLFLQKNRLVGTIPDDVGLLKYLGLLKMSHNMLSGRIPESIGKMQRLKRLFLHHNHLSDIIPTSLGWCKHLQLLDLSHNSLTGGISEDVANISGIKFYLNLSYNYLEGVVPKAIGELVLAEAVDISRNRLTGVIPDTLGNCRALKYFNLSSNSIQGTIPYSLGILSNLAHLDLSFNSLSGEMPTALKKLASLRSLNLSYNSLVGDIDKGGSFANSTIAISLVGNIGLCGSIVPCLPVCGKRSHSITPKIAFGAAAAGVTALMLLLTLMWKGYLLKFLFCLLSQSSTVSVYPKWTRIKMISYDDIVTATDDFSDDNLVGRTNVGSVYKGSLTDGLNVAVKVLDLINEEAHKSFKAECEAYRWIRHRNLPKIVATCYDVNFKGMVFKFVCNGSLEAQLHPRSDGGCQLRLKERLNIAIDIAHAMEYLHHDCPVQVVHCDIKPSNVLLDEDMTAYVTDFGIARILGVSNETSLDSMNLTGTLGYIAPEYGLSSEVSTKGDVYSYGILLMEMFCGKRPTDEMFLGDLDLHKWVKAAFLSGDVAVIDESLTASEFTGDIQFIAALLLIGLVCSKHPPEARPTMKHVTAMLEWIRKDLTNSQGLCELMTNDAWFTLAQSNDLYAVDPSRHRYITDDSSSIFTDCSPAGRSGSISQIEWIRRDLTNSEGLGEGRSEDAWLNFADCPAPGGAGNISPMQWIRKDFANSEGLGKVRTEDTWYSFAESPTPGRAGSISPIKDLTNCEEHFRDGVDEVPLRRVSWRGDRGAASGRSERCSGVADDIWSPIAPVGGERESWLARAERLDALLADAQAAKRD